MTAGDRFCISCGGALDSNAPADAAERSADGPLGRTERRRVSVLFVDLENFTALAESLDPEEVRTVQSRYFEAARSVVARYGGTIEKFIGDAVMAVWGAPAAHEDDPGRAVQAALALVDAVGRLGGAASGNALSARAAVTTGEAAVTVGATGQGMVAGDLVSTAARLQVRAPTGGVLADATTRRLAPDAALYHRGAALALRGRAGRVMAYRASRRDSPADQPVGAHAGPFVGRERELRELVGLLETVMRDRRSRLVSVTGVAGVGKSRLVWELGEHIEARPEGIAWHLGRAPAYGEDTTFAAVADMVRRRIRAPHGVPPELARRQLAATLRELVRDDGERRWMEPRVAVLLARDAEAAFSRDELFAAWRRFFERVADRAPAVLVFEDLQWADPSLLDFIEHLATWTRHHPMLILAVARPELLDHRPSWGAGLGSFTALHLERLPDRAMRELLRRRGPSLDEALVRRILERAGGVPLYAVEVIGVLGASRLADGERRRQPRSGRAVPPTSHDVPDSLHGLIAARIDALPPAERRLLLAAAVLGRRFHPDALAAVAGSDAVDVAARIEALARRDLLALDDEPASPGHGELSFVQDLVREVAYRTLPRDERRALHLAAARYLDTKSDQGSLAASRAGHLVEAHRLAPEHPDAVRIARRAAAALRQAAREAIRLHAPDRALDHLENALRLPALAEQRPALLDEAAAAARAAARLELAERHLRELIEHHTTRGEATEAARARAQLASVLLMAQRNDAALAELASALDAIGDMAADPAGAELASQLARAQMLVGDDRAGLAWADRALEAAERHRLEAVATDVLVTRGTARFRLGDEEGGLADLRRAIAAAERGGFLGVELRARNNLAWLVVADDPHLTLDTARHGLALATSMGVGDMAVQFAEVACTAAVETADWEFALKVAADMEPGPMADAARIDIAASVASIRALRGDAAPLAILESLEPLPPETDPQVVASIDHARAWEALVRGSLKEAEEHAKRAMAGSLGAERAHQLGIAARAALWARDRAAVASALDALGGLGLHGRAVDASAATIAAGLAALDGRPDARALYRDAAERWRQLELPLHLALCLLDLERSGIGDGEGRMEAIGTLREIGAGGLLASADDGAMRDLSSPGGRRPPARRRRPTSDTARPTGAGRRPRRATGRPARPG